MMSVSEVLSKWVVAFDVWSDCVPKWQTQLQTLSHPWLVQGELHPTHQMSNTNLEFWRLTSGGSPCELRHDDVARSIFSIRLHNSVYRDATAILQV